MAQTKLSSLINPQVMADMISAELPSKIKFAPLAKMNDELVGQPGNTITVPKYAYIGDAEDVAEGVAVGTTVLSASTTQATVKKAVKSVELTDESVLSAHGDPVGETTSQLADSIASKLDADLALALEGAALSHDASAAKISYNAIVDGVDKFAEEDDEERILFIHPEQKGTLRKDQNFIDNVPNAFMTGVIGEVAGCQVVASKKVKKVSDGAGGFKFTNFIVKPGALAVYLKREVQIKSQEDILAGTTVLVANKHYAAVLANDSKVVKLVTKA